MKLKKSISILLAVLLTMSFLPLFATAADAPTRLYVGEREKTEDNLITMYEKTGYVRVYSVTDSQSYYEVTRENGRYVLTFYTDYQISQPVDYNGIICGVYCDGDLIIRVKGSVTLDLDKTFKVDGKDEKYAGAYGIYCRGNLTVEGERRSDLETMIVRGDMTKSDAGSSVGIYANALIVDHITIYAYGGYTAVETKTFVASINADMHCNDLETVKVNGQFLFTYGLVTRDMIFARSNTRVRGLVNIKTYAEYEAHTDFPDDDIVVYLRNYYFLPRDGYNYFGGIWHTTYTFLRNFNEYPFCISLRKEDVNGRGRVATISGDTVKLVSRGSATISMVITCGRSEYVLDTFTVSCSIAWYQWIPYILSFEWIKK